MFKKRIIAALLVTVMCLAMCIATAVPASARSGEIRVILDGSVIRLDTPPQIVNGRVMVPMRSLLEHFGASVEMIPSSRTVTAETNDGEIYYMTIGSRVISINNTDYILSEPPQVVDGRTMITAQLAAYIAGVHAIWSPAANAVIIITPSYLTTPDFPRGLSAITLPNRRLTASERNAWIDEYNRLGGPHELELEVVRLVNVERARAGLAPVRICPTLNTVARFKAQSMADLGYYDHIGVYGDAADLARAFGHRNEIGENLYRGPQSAAWAMAGWMNSEKHREIILHRHFETIGVGIYVCDDGRFHWAQMFSVNR